MGTTERDSGMDKLQKTANELEGMLQSALQKQHGAINDLNIRVFRTKAGLPDWNAEIVGGERVVEDAVKDTFEKASLELQRQFGGIIVLEPTESPMMHKLCHALTAEDRRVARSWAWGVLIVYSACALTVFGLASLIQHSADASKEPAATAVTATTNRNQLTR